MENRPTIADIRQAAERIKPFVHRTPVLVCSALDEMSGASLFFKCENLQKVGAFKIRGACNTVFCLGDEQAARGVATHSSGNHAAAVALAARWRGVKAYVVMPENTPEVKKAAVAGYGAEITYCVPTLEARDETLAEVVKATGAAVVHAYDDRRVIAGQGTAALELCEEVADLDVVMAPVDGGMALSGLEMIRVLKRLKSSLVLPMHWFGDSTLHVFLSGMADQFEIERSTESFVEVSLRSLPRTPTVMVLRPRYLRTLQE